MTQPGGRRRLGRGLEALLGPTSVEDARAEGSLAQLPIDRIRPNPYQPRRTVGTDALAELADSMRSSGLLQPIVVRPVGEGEYELIAGERRWRAARTLGWQEIGAVVREVDDQTLLTFALVENLQRDALSPIEEALGYQRLIDEFHVSQKAVGELVGRDRSTVANALRLLKLPEGVRSLVDEGSLSPGHARALLAVENDAAAERLAARTVDDALSVREVEQLVRDGREPRGRKARRRGRKPPSPEMRRVEDALRGRLKTDVRVTTRGKSGRVIVNFYSADDLSRLLEIILGEPFDG
ncbi:MAG: ParB/RepB/Spo0J family partition protein [Gemmatimonadales bacterium]